MWLTHVCTECLHKFWQWRKSNLMHSHWTIYEDIFCQSYFQTFLNCRRCNSSVPLLRTTFDLNANTCGCSSQTYTNQTCACAPKATGVAFVRARVRASPMLDWPLLQPDGHPCGKCGHFPALRWSRLLVPHECCWQWQPWSLVLDAPTPTSNLLGLLFSHPEWMVIQMQNSIAKLKISRWTLPDKGLPDKHSLLILSPARVGVYGPLRIGGIKNIQIEKGCLQKLTSWKPFKSADGTCICPIRTQKICTLLQD